MYWNQLSILDACNHDYNLQTSSFICLNLTKVLANSDLPIGASDHKMLTWVISEGNDKQQFLLCKFEGLGFG